MSLTFYIWRKNFTIFLTSTADFTLRIARLDGFQFLDDEAYVPPPISLFLPKVPNKSDFSYNCARFLSRLTLFYSHFGAAYWTRRIWMGFIYDWCEERFEIQSIADDILAKFVPAHVNIFYCFGGIMVTSFIFQGATGFALTIYYQPTVVEAFPSLQLILYDVNLARISSAID